MAVKRARDLSCSYRPLRPHARDLFLRCELRAAAVDRSAHWCNRTSVRRVAVLVSPIDPEAPSMIEVVKSAARARHVQLDLVEIRDPADLVMTYATSRKRGQALYIIDGER